MSPNFEQCYHFTVSKEGRWSDRPKSVDPGGKTMRGLTLKAYSEWLGRKATPTELRNISEAVHKRVFHDMYWVKAGCDKMILPVAAVVFDTAIHSGPYRAVRILQESLNHYRKKYGFEPIKVDGVMGSKTSSAVNSAASFNLAIDMVIRRLAFMTSLSNWHANSRGWAKQRIHDLWRFVEECHEHVRREDAEFERKRLAS